MANKLGHPYLPNLPEIHATGITRFSSNNKCTLKADIKRFLREIDEADFCNRFTWYNLPNNISSQELERLLYYKGQVCFFYDKDLEQFYFMPYALDGTIDFYGRYNSVHPVPMTSGTDEDKDRSKALATILSGKKLKCVYGIKMEDEIEEDDLYNSTVLLADRTKQLSQTTTPRQIINDPLLDTMAEYVPFMRTASIIATGIKGLRIPDADSNNADEINRNIVDQALEGKMFAPVIGNIDYQELAAGNTSAPADYMQALQSLDNLRLSGYGIDNGGLFDKKAHVLQSEMDLNGGPVGLVLQDSLATRQNFCNIVNSIWNLGIWCDVNQNISGADVDGDGLLYDTNDLGENSGIETEPQGGEQDANE